LTQENSCYNAHPLACSASKPRAKMMTTMIDRGAASPRHALVDAGRRKATFAADRRTKDRLHVALVLTARARGPVRALAKAQVVAAVAVRMAFVHRAARDLPDLRAVHLVDRRWLAAAVECGACRQGARTAPNRSISGWCGLSASSIRFCVS
jgi:hypothetical protein